MSRGAGTAGQVNGLEMLIAKGGSGRCLKVREHELTFDVLIMPAGCGTLELWMENQVAGGDYRHSTWLDLGRNSREWVRGLS